MVAKPKVRACTRLKPVLVTSAKTTSMFFSPFTYREPVK